jgi:hypothetical protein
MKRPEFLFVVLAAAMIPTSAMAYLDPVTGSIVWQMAVGGLLAAAATMRLYWSRIRSFFSKKDGDAHDVIAACRSVEESHQEARSGDLLSHQRRTNRRS